MKNKKKIILGVLVGVLIGSIIGITYAIFSYTGTSRNEQLITGDIYMHYKESNTLTLENALPSSTYDSTKYFEFTIDGKNTNTKYDIYYDILLNRGDVPTGKQETNRIQDKFIKFRLTKFVENETTHEMEETEIFTNKSYNDLSTAKRIHVATIPKNTMSEITHRYRLYMWIGNEVVIGNTGNSGIDYDMTTWNNLFASIKVSSTGDFEEKKLEVEATDASCFTTTDNGDNTVSITGYDVSCGGTDVVIPETIDNKTVTEIGSLAFSNKQLVSIKIPDYVVKLDFRAFANNYITNVIIPNSVLLIGDGAFASNNIERITISNNITEIGFMVFGDNQLTNVEIPDSVITIGGSAFAGNQLTNVEIPDSVTTIGSNAFSGNQLTSVEIGDSVTTIGQNAFWGNQLTSVTIGNGIISIDLNAFNKNSDYNQNLSSITINKSCNDIKNNILGSNLGRDSTNYYPWLSSSSPYTASGVTIYGSNNEICDAF